MSRAPKLSSQEDEVIQQADVITNAYYIVWLISLHYVPVIKSVTLERRGVTIQTAPGLHSMNPGAMGTAV